MHFKDMKYVRPDMDTVRADIKALLAEFENAQSFDEQDEIIQKVNELRIDFNSMRTLAFINYSVNTADEKFSDEQDYFDDKFPEYSELISDYYRLLVNSRFRNEIEEKYGKQLFIVAEMMLKSISHEVIEDLKIENHYGSQYLKIIASAKIQFDGKEMNLQEFKPYFESLDRDVRKKAVEAYWGFFEDKGAELDELYEKMVQNRNDIALKLGFKNFIELAYVRMERSDYNAEDVAKFRKYVKDHIVPLSNKLREMQKDRLGLNKLKIYDLPVFFKNGNANPKGGPEWIVEQGKKMYDELSPETGEFFNYMINHGLMDLYSRKGKADMGYCDYIPKYKNPFIFANMNGTDYDITVLTHEAGHAFQAYSSGHFPIKEYFDTTSEAAEIHSMSMEFLTWPWMDLFFGDQTEKFKYAHMAGTVLFLPYGCLVDEFQHYVYENPSDSPEQRRMKWLELEKEYMPFIDYDGIKPLEDGRKWQKQGHIYEVPFYYIDYCLAQICAYQFWKKANENRTEALEDYIRLCKAGGSQSFLDLVKYANLKSPFDPECIKEMVDNVEEWLSGVEHMSL
jgi:M3 family oligoendopeptidase